LVETQYGHGSSANKADRRELYSIFSHAEQIVLEHEIQAVERMTMDDDKKQVVIEGLIVGLRLDPSDSIDDLLDKVAERRHEMGITTSLSAAATPVNLGTLSTLPPKDVLKSLTLQEQAAIMKDHGFVFKNPNQASYKAKTLTNMIDEQYDYVFAAIKATAPAAASPTGCK
jgi:hypothetical protein